MKKLLSAIAAIVVSVSLAACGSNGAASETTIAEITTVADTSVVQQETVPEETTETQMQNETEAVSEEQLMETTSEISAETTVTTALSEQIDTNTETEETEAANDETVSDEEIIIDDSAEEMTVSSKFADMDEFLSADIFMLNGKTASADKTLSADVFNTLKGDFCYETSEFDGSSPYKLVKKGSEIMTEAEVDGRTNQMIITNSKAYTFDHENKIALYLPADKELISMYAPEKMGIIPENISKESFVIADIVIAGKSYKFEYGTTSDWAMLYDANGKLYASVQSGDSLDLSLCKFSVTSKIPSDAFDIPEDYMQIDLEEMMQNAPPPEEIE